MRILRRFSAEEGGATSIEYALIAGIIGLGIIISVSAIPTALNSFFNNAATKISQ